MTVSTEGTATVLPPGGPAAPARPIPAARRGLGSRGTLLFLEAAVAFAAALVLPLLARGFNFNPLDRIAQVSGLAAIQLRFALIGLVFIGAVALAVRLRGGRHFDLATRFASAALAGLASGFVAAGAVVALHGTPWPMFGLNGDSGRIVEWAHAVANGRPSGSPVYPPAPLHTLGYYAEWFRGGNTAYAFKDLQILGAAAFGPLVYLSWRMLLGPVRALAFGVAPAFALIDAYKPYSQTVLVVLVPVLVAMVVSLSRSGTQGWRPLLLKGAGFGALLGVLFLTYSGWFLWSAAGVLFAALLYFPWRDGRTGRIKGAAFLGASLAAFLVVAGRYLMVMLTEGQTTKDYNFRFDNFTDPAYYLMWRTDMPGKVGEWPLPGEYGGVGLFALVTFVGLGAAIWLGMRKPMVVTIAAMFISAWVMRMYIASNMYETQTVQLYTRTNNQLLYCGLLLCALVVHLVSQRMAARSAQSTADAEPAAATAGAGGTGFPGREGAVIGAMCALLLLLGTVSSSMADRYMPAKENTYRILPWVSHTITEQDGSCPKYAPGGTCSKDGDQSWLSFIR
ncbi:MULTISPECIES: hypothetical protein [Streptomyces]|uniref:hypothetical protein n=1 Tax=Streptomyces TaxID=1883 RepID=UPI0004BDE735|nr:MULTISPECIES: hypothetical protein [Streptomyces]KJY22082.1 hypothetical protein VR43_07815 [Streptomyces sp. NRRL S-104]KOU28364.1 hypothetical protein ADK53_34465 [Streptomyces sp. WM6373]KOU69504.1 hypothetical protein ADK61_37130 [Streptomyces sp. XY66]KOU81524.1 hypothetical protein ADK93_30815 [Streptomyces sp. XY58]KOV04680.1 hypothetical protein ADK89_22820 [Streptomyces sp. XY37]